MIRVLKFSWWLGTCCWLQILKRYDDQRKPLRVRSVLKVGVCFSVRFCIMSVSDAPVLLHPIKYLVRCSKIVSYFVSRSSVMGLGWGWPQHWQGSVPTDQGAVPQDLSRVGRAGMVVTRSINSRRHREVMEQVQVHVGSPVRNSRGWGWRRVHFWHRNIGYESVIGHVGHTIVQMVNSL